MPKRRAIVVGLAWASWITTALPLPAQLPEPLLPPESAHLAAGSLCEPPCSEMAVPCEGFLGFWARLEYLLWWMKPVCLKPVTLTVGNPGDPVPGALGQPGTQVVMGGHRFEFAGASGVRPAVGMSLLPWLDVEAEGFLLDRVTATEEFVSVNGGPATFIPFQLPTNAQAAIPFSIPGLVNGSSTAVGSSRFWGVEANLAAHFSLPCDACQITAGLLGGFRYLNLEDEVLITNVQGLVADPTKAAVGQDNFTTRNQFYGPQVGYRIGVSRGAWLLEWSNKLAVGQTYLVSEVAGQPLAAPAVVPGLVPGPVLALPSNSGRLSSSRVSLVPEVAVKARYRISEQVGLSLGYSLIYWNRILCPGDQMDSHVNPTQLPFRGPPAGPADPGKLFVFTDYFAQGLNLGLEIQF